jgi:hypothetical protein
LLSAITVVAEGVLALECDEGVMLDVGDAASVLYMVLVVVHMVCGNFAGTRYARSCV